MSAREQGAEIRVRTKLVGAKREGGVWRATLVDADGVRSEVAGRAIVNVGGPWVKVIRDTLGSAPSKENVRHVKGSHIVVPRVHEEPHAYILQNADNRIVFVIPFEDRYSLIGTTDVPVTSSSTRKSRRTRSLPARPREHLPRRAADREGRRLDVLRASGRSTTTGSPIRRRSPATTC